MLNPQQFQCGCGAINYIGRATCHKCGKAKKQDDSTTKRRSRRSSRSGAAATAAAVPTSAVTATVEATAESSAEEAGGDGGGASSSERAVEAEAVAAVVAPPACVASPAYAAPPVCVAAPPAAVAPPVAPPASVAAASPAGVAPPPAEDEQQEAAEASSDVTEAELSEALRAVEVEAAVVGELSDAERESVGRRAAGELMARFEKDMDQEVADYVSNLVVELVVDDDDDALESCVSVLGAHLDLEDEESLRVFLTNVAERARLALLADRVRQRTESDDQATLLSEVFPQVHPRVVHDYLQSHGGDINAAAEALHRATEEILRAESLESSRRSHQGAGSFATVAPVHFSNINLLPCRSAVEREASFFKTVLTDAQREKIAVSYGITRNVPKDGCHRPINFTADGGTKRQTRFRDGKVVSTRGERHLTEPKEDSDFVKNTSVNLTTIIGGGRTH